MTSISESLQETQKSLYGQALALEECLNELDNLLLLLEICEFFYTDINGYDLRYRKFEILFFTCQPRLSLQVNEMRWTLIRLKKYLDEL